MDLSSILNDPGNPIINGSDDDIISSSGDSEAQPQDSPATMLPACESDNDKTVNMKSLSSMPFESAAKGRKYINHDLADEVLKSYQNTFFPITN